ncbi:uncharacterized protein BXZ73DRAFT_79797 [Epithele typhae]|uniref:uncharacterized protein n=1 Tax=Epithele typhae TaxID=378194 RepID=UPI0020074F44|nr:uncharacterized protein BXZ73DRAFT_79797 [Epithele typhae]KAH9922000.1 hypothetical protein BXZ73DRAFT_79797 [Epithele typhae]
MAGSQATPSAPLPAALEPQATPATPTPPPADPFATMQLTFCPALGQTTAVKVAVVSKDGCAGQTPTLVFRAAFDSPKSRQQAKADGTRVELWSDIPFEGRARGEWGAIAFGPWARPEGSEVGTLSATSRSGQRTPSAKPTAKKTPSISAYSCRFKSGSPSGRVHWLGEFGGNGVVVFERGLSGVTFGEGWQQSDADIHHVETVGERVVAQLNTPTDWTRWTWTSNKFPAQTMNTETSVGSAVVLSPKSYKRGVSVPEPLVIAASCPASVSISPDGTISVDAAGSLSFSSLKNAAGVLLDLAARRRGVFFVRDEVAIFASPMAADSPPFHVLVMPLAEVTGPCAVPFAWLQPLISQPPEAEVLALYSPAQHQARVVRTSSEGRGSVLVDGSGGELLASPVLIVQNRNTMCYLAPLSAYKRINAMVEDRANHPLPTPPPSPPTRSSPAMLASELPPTPSKVHSPTPTPFVPSRPQLTSERRFSHRRRPSLSLIRALPGRIIRSYIHTIFNVVAWFWSCFFKAITMRLIGEGIPRRISGVLGFLLVQTASSRSRDSTGIPESDPSQARGEPKPEARKKVVESSGETRGAPVASTEPITAPQLTHTSSFAPPKHEESHSRVTVTAEVAADVSTSAMFLWQGAITTKLGATLDGTPLPTPEIVSAGDDTYLVTISDATASGLLEVSFVL